MTAINAGTADFWRDVAARSDAHRPSVGARHLRRYYVAGRTGDGSISDLAARGLDATSPSVSAPVPGETVLVGVRRALDVTVDVAPSFGVPT